MVSGGGLLLLVGLLATQAHCSWWTTQSASSDVFGRKLLQAQKLAAAPGSAPAPTFHWNTSTASSAPAPEATAAVPALAPAPAAHHPLAPAAAPALAPAGAPAVPGVPAVPAAPAVPAVPATPATPAVPAVPATPGVPGVPGAPALPAAPIIINQAAPGAAATTPAGAPLPVSSTSVASAPGEAPRAAVVALAPAPGAAANAPTVLASAPLASQPGASPAGRICACGALDAWQLAAILLCQLTEGVQITLPYTVAVYMEVGWRTGILAACFCFSQFLTSYLWGRASDVALAMTLLSLAWGAGTVLGPVIGGALSLPCEHTPSLPLCAHGQLLQRRPFLLPCVATAALSAAAMLSSVLLLRETRRQAATGLEPQKLSQGARTQSRGLRRIDSAQESGRRAGLELAAMKISSVPALSIETDSVASAPTPAHHAERQRQVLLTLVGYGMIAMLFNLLDELTPLLASTPPSLGGLGLSPSQLAVPLAVSGIALVASAVGFPPLARLLGTLATLKLGLWLAAPAAAGLAAPSLLPRALGAWAPQAALGAVLCAKSASSTLAFTASMILVNTAAPADQLGSVNGAGQALASLVRALGPASGGASWAASISLGPPIGQFLPFLSVAAAMLATQLLYRRVALHGV
ncbi:hypothetical protein WJX81_001226 [Elliptochloris bilobata]|uniref:Uncharacterized protein n=1 Tax=Elliptochloris bilobata TaxID=381761 RepID=A0AAW1SK88_9CHLO